VQCVSCGEDNDNGLRYCVACGNALTSHQVGPTDALLAVDSLVPPGTVLKNTYEIVRILGEGGAGAVYEGRHVHLGHPVAIKVLFAELARIGQIRERFIAEGRIQANLRHPNLVAVSDIVDEAGLVAIVMDYVEGETLHHFIQGNREPVGVRKAVDIMLRLLAGLSLVHGKGIVHRDIKPGNVLLARATDGVVPKLCDFGIAKTDSQKGLTVTGTQMGTLHYMAPEQFQDARTVDARADIYALGVTFFELLTGRLPFDSDNEYALMRAHLDVQPPSPRSYRPELHEALEAVVLRCLEKRPERRFQSADELAEALLAIPQFTTLQNYKSMPVVTDVMPKAVPMQVGVGHGRKRATVGLDRTSLPGDLPDLAAPRTRVSRPGEPPVRTTGQQRRAMAAREEPKPGNGFAIFLAIFALGLAAVVAWWFWERSRPETGGDGGEGQAGAATLSPGGNEEPEGTGAVAATVGGAAEQAGEADAGAAVALSGSEDAGADGISFDQCVDLIDVARTYLRDPTEPMSDELGARLETLFEPCSTALEAPNSDRAHELLDEGRAMVIAAARHLYRLQTAPADQRCMHAINADSAYQRATGRLADALRLETLLQIEQEPVLSLRADLGAGHSTFQVRWTNCL
jgi:serine/threonine protein kinase